MRGPEPACLDRRDICAYQDAKPGQIPAGSETRSQKDLDRLMAYGAVADAERALVRYPS